MASFFPGWELTDAQLVRSMTLEESVARAINLLQMFQPEEGYWLAFSGGKDSCVIKQLAIEARVKFDAHYANTTIDAPELVRFIKRVHPDVEWETSKHGNMFHRIATRPGPPPTRSMRWCCDEYKELHARDRIKLFGVRADESPDRAHRWKEVSLGFRGYASICPIVYWTTQKLFSFIADRSLEICELYAEGWDRLGCVGCFLNPQSRSKEFERWPKYGQRWKEAVIKNWENHQGKLRRDGKPYMHARFKTGEEFWQWWINENRHDDTRDDCQLGILWTNEAP